MELGSYGRDQAPDDYNIDGLLGGSAPGRSVLSLGRDSRSHEAESTATSPD